MTYSSGGSVPPRFDRFLLCDVKQRSSIPGSSTPRLYVQQRELPSGCFSHTIFVGLGPVRLRRIVYLFAGSAGTPRSRGLTSTYSASITSAF